MPKNHAKDPSTRRAGLRTAVLASGIALVSMGCAQASDDAEKPFDINAADLGSALNQFARQSERQIVFSNVAVAGKQATRLRGNYKPSEALAMLLRESGLTYKIAENDVIVIASEPKVVADSPAAAAKRDGTSDDDR
jgi:hypothetical protein